MKGEAKLGGYTLAFDFNALCDAEAVVGPIGAAMTEIAKGSFSTIRALVWAGLKKHHDKTLEQSGEIIAEVGFTEAAEAVGLAMQTAFPEAKGKAGNGKPQP